MPDIPASIRANGTSRPGVVGVHRLASLNPLAHPDLVTVATLVLQGIVCLISALSFHELRRRCRTISTGTRARDAEAAARLPADALLLVLGAAFHEGVETHERDNASVRVCATCMGRRTDLNRFIGAPAC